MLPDIKTVKNISNKELNLFFASPIGYLFLGVFVAVTLFNFFWGSSFFARNIADVRPMFEMMPIFLIFLCAALTMRMWSEERRSGTLEHVMTLPVDPWQFIWGKFAACKTLLALALLLTLPLPITVSFIAELDWGPVISAYLATMFLGTAYLAIGLFISSRSDNQIVSLILTVIICSIFYFLGSPTLTDIVNNSTGEILRALGSGSRFESITRGVLDLRDIYYYLSIVLIFLVLNRYALEKDRWQRNVKNRHHRQWYALISLLVINILVANFWLSPLGSLRFDTTKGKMYSLSEASENYLNQLQEPLLVRAYFSAKTHPLLAPLVPEVQDLLKEYEEKANGKLRVEFIDPARNPDAEEEAGSKYGIRPTPFRIADRYQSAVVNSYFNVLILYGDDYKVLGFDDLIEVKPAANGMDLDVRLRNPEYDITNAIKQVLYAYQSSGSLFSTIKNNVEFTGYISAGDRLPESLQAFTNEIEQSLQALHAEASDKFSYKIVDPDANGGQVAQEIEENYGFRPMASSLFDTNTFYYYLVLRSGELAVQIPLPDDLSKDTFERSLDAGLKRFSAGFTKTVGIVAPEINPYMAQMGQGGGNASFNTLQQVLNENMTAKTLSLSKGVVEDDVDLLMILAPENLDEKSVFAIDQYLMKGGTVVLASSPLQAEYSQQGLSAKQIDSGLNDWLAHHGLSIKPTFVMDSQSAPFPVPVTRQVGMFSVREMMMVDYPYFIDLRDDSLNQNNPITSSLPELIFPWASPLSIDEQVNSERELIELAHSSASSWLSPSTQITPSLDAQGNSVFATGDIQGKQLLAAVIKGRFSSYFEGKPSPLLATEAEEQDGNNEADTTEEDTGEQAQEVITSVIEKSSEAATLIVLASNSIAEDRAMSMSGASAMGDAAPAQLLVNAAEWSLEDTALLSIRARGHFNRTLPPMEDTQKQHFELMNYVFALLSLVLVFIVRKILKGRTQRRYQNLLQSI